MDKIILQMQSIHVAVVWYCYKENCGLITYMFPDCFAFPCPLTLIFLLFVICYFDICLLFVTKHKRAFVHRCSTIRTFYTELICKFKILKIKGVIKFELPSNILYNVIVNILSNVILNDHSCCTTFWISNISSVQKKHQDVRICIYSSNKVSLGVLAFCWVFGSINLSSSSFSPLRFLIYLFIYLFSGRVQDQCPCLK